MLPETAQAVLDFIEKCGGDEIFRKGSPENFIGEVVNSFLEEDPNHNPTDVQFAIEYFVGVSDKLNAQRAQVLKRVSKKYAKNIDNPIKEVRANAIAFEASMKEKMLRLTEEYFEASEKGGVAEYKRKAKIREDMDALRDLSKMGSVINPLVVQASERQLKREEAQLAENDGARASLAGVLNKLISGKESS